MTHPEMTEIAKRIEGVIQSVYPHGEYHYAEWDEETGKVSLIQAWFPRLYTSGIEAISKAIHTEFGDDVKLDFVTPSVELTNEEYIVHYGDLGLPIL